MLALRYDTRFSYMRGNLFITVGILWDSFSCSASALLALPFPLLKPLFSRVCACLSPVFFTHNSYPSPTPFASVGVRSFWSRAAATCGCVSALSIRARVRSRRCLSMQSSLVLRLRYSVARSLLSSVLFIQLICLFRGLAFACSVELDLSVILCAVSWDSMGGAGVDILVDRARI